jgi:hypothetical protein
VLSFEIDRMREYRGVALLALMVFAACGRTRLEPGSLPFEDDAGGAPGSSSGEAGSVTSSSGMSTGGTRGGALPVGGTTGVDGEPPVAGASTGGAGSAGEGQGGAAGSDAGAAGSAGEAPACEAAAGEPGAVSWLTSGDEVGIEQPRGLALDHLGNVLVAGNAVDGKGIELAKYDASGKRLWLKVLSSTLDVAVGGLAVDASDDIVLAGSFRGQLELDPKHPGQVTLAALQQQCQGNDCGVTEDVFVTKLTPEGVPIWARAHGDNAIQRVTAVVSDGLGHIALAGSFSGSLDFAVANLESGSGPNEVSSDALSANKCDGYVVELDDNGQLIWGRAFGSEQGTCQRPMALAFADDDVVLAGGYYGALTFAGVVMDPLPRVNSAEVLLARFSRKGALVFAHGYAHTSNQYATGVAVAPGGDLWLVGSFGKEVNFAPNDAGAALVSNGSGDVFLARFSGDGDYVDGRHYGDNLEQLGTSIVVDDAGAITIGGTFIKSVAFGLPEPLVTTTGAFGDVDAFVAHFGADFSARWQLSLGSAQPDATSFLTRFCDGSPLVLGNFGGDAKLSNGDSLESFGANAPWLTRLVP